LNGKSIGKENNMSLREILQKMVEKGEPILLSDSEKDWEAGDLLSKLSEHKLRTRAHLQPGMYIAEINDAGYLGRVMFKLKQKA
jgi:hypothetical protein